MSMKQIPVLAGWFSDEDGKPYLIGTRCQGCGTYYFPQQKQYCRNPDCCSESFTEVPLSREGIIWSFTNAMYQPPEPYVAEDPHVPYTIIAVELKREKMIVLGQGIRGLTTSELEVGMPVELTTEPLFELNDQQTMTWKWAPIKSRQL